MNAPTNRIRLATLQQKTAQVLHCSAILTPPLERIDARAARGHLLRRRRQHGGRSDGGGHGGAGADPALRAHAWESWAPGALIVCAECEEAPAAVQCAQCEDPFCHACAEYVHRKGKKALHDLEDIEGNVTQGKGL